MRTTPLVLTAAAIALVVIPQGALAACTVSQSSALLTTTFSSRTYYIATGCGDDLCPFAEFVYQESNNIAGLQRYDGIKDDTCGNPALADVQVW